MGAFIRNLWYVAAWSHEVGQEKPIGRMVIGEPIVLYRTAGGSVAVLEDRCPHRHAALSLGKVEGDDLRCMYHGLKFSPAGRCIDIPASPEAPKLSCRRYPAHEASNWIWVWMGEPEKADPSTIPEAFGLDDPRLTMMSGGMDYSADYQLVHDNLLDLCHLDYLHEKSLGGYFDTRLSGVEVSIEKRARSLRISRWFKNMLIAPGRPERADTLSEYDFSVSGTFVMKNSSYPVGTADVPPERLSKISPFVVRVEQQAVTPTKAGASRYLFAAGISSEHAHPGVMEGFWKVILETFEEDRLMIEAQHRIWTLTSDVQRKGYLPQDKAPAMLRRMIADMDALEAKT